MPLHLLAAF